MQRDLVCNCFGTTLQSIDEWSGEFGSPVTFAFTRPIRVQAVATYY